MKTNRVAGFFKEVGGIVKDLWNTVEESGYCCGVRLDPPCRCEQMPTAGSCCGVRA